jgi:hypothetical protein
MSDVSLDIFEPIVVKALTHEDFRKRLFESSVSAINAAKEEGIELDGEDIIKLRKLKPSIERFAATKNLHIEDAKNWAVGALISVAKKDWPLNTICWKEDYRHPKV